MLWGTFWGTGSTAFGRLKKNVQEMNSQKSGVVIASVYVLLLLSIATQARIAQTHTDILPDAEPLSAAWNNARDK